MITTIITTVTPCMMKLPKPTVIPLMIIIIAIPQVTKLPTTVIPLMIIIMAMPQVTKLLKKN